MLVLPLLSLLACEDPPPPPPAYAPDLSAWSGAEAACLQAQCAASASADMFTSCHADRCAPTAEAWVVNPTLLRYDDGVVTVSVQVEHTPASVGGVAEPHVGDTWLGATVLTSKGEEIDMAVQTVFPDRLGGDPFTFSSEVGADVQVVIVGLWGKKIEPCDSTRSGCQMFGFVLDESLAAWPVDTYVESPARRQRFLPPELAVQLATTPISPERKTALVEALASVWRSEEQRFGTHFTVTEVPSAPGAATTGAAVPGVSEVVHKHEHDGPLASRVAGTIGTGVPVRHDPAAAVDLVVNVGATACPPGMECR
ncbi:MAG: hypothetical protein Q8P41_17815 [Pseudomonadota bacterium]|nr:hypothetical protein [Pseudomonadota bacterium]